MTHTHPQKKQKEKNPDKKEDCNPPLPRWTTNMIVDKEKMTTTWMKIKEQEVAKPNFLASCLKCLTETTASQDWTSIQLRETGTPLLGAPPLPQEATLEHLSSLP